MLIRAFGVIGTLVGVLFLAGCNAVGQADFSCSGPTPGLSCLPAMEVYEITNDPELQKKVIAALEAAAASGDEFDHQAVIDRVKAEHKPRVEIVKKIAQPVKQPKPVLHPAKVLRIYIAPWVDNKGDLRMPGYLFTEVTPRRWSFGESELPNVQILAPVQVETHEGGD